MVETGESRRRHKLGVAQRLEVCCPWLPQASFKKTAVDKKTSERLFRGRVRKVPKNAENPQFMVKDICGCE